MCHPLAVYTCIWVYLQLGIYIHTYIHKYYVAALKRHSTQFGRCISVSIAAVEQIVENLNTSSYILIIYRLWNPLEISFSQILKLNEIIFSVYIYYLMYIYVLERKFPHNRYLKMHSLDTLN